MRVLLDTNVVIWSLFDPPRIRGEGADVLKAADTRTVVSVVSFWEIAIKRSTGKLAAPDDLPARVRELGHEILVVTEDHAWCAGALPPHHRDPFDRLLVAQAQTEGLPLVTSDRALNLYDLKVIRA